MNTLDEDNDQSQWVLDRRRDARQGIRWLRIMVYGACFVAVALIAAGRAQAAGTVTDSTSVVLQRSGVTQLPNPTSIAECKAKMAAMIKDELARRTTGYITYKCLDISQSYVKFANAPPPPTLGQVMLKWTPPSKNIDGTPLDNLAGHRIVYGTAPTSLSQMIQVPIPLSSSSFTVDGLAPATYYFAVKAYTTAGIESANSNVTSKTIQ